MSIYRKRMDSVSGTRLMAAGISVLTMVQLTRSIDNLIRDRSVNSTLELVGNVCIFLGTGTVALKGL